MYNQCSKPVRIGVGSDKVFQVQLFLDGAPFDLTDMTAIAASFPAPNLGSVVESVAKTTISVVGAPGAGRIQITCPSEDTLAMQANPVPEQFQDLQIVVTSEGVAQVDVLSIPVAPTGGAIFTVTLNGNPFSYTASAGDTDLVVFNAIQALIAAVAQPFPISAAVSGSAGTAALTLTSTIPALGFIDQVTSNITKGTPTPNSGTRALFVMQAVLNIVAEPYPLV